MTDENTETPVVETEQETPEGAQEAPEDTATDAEETNEQDEEFDQERARKEISDLRKEAARYRTQLRETQDQLSKAKSPEEVDGIVKEYQDKVAALELETLRSKIASEYRIPDALVDRLRGTTEEELKADAESLQSVFGQSNTSPTPTNPGGGLDPDEDSEDSFDPVAYARNMRQRSGPGF